MKKLFLKDEYPSYFIRHKVGKMEESKMRSQEYFYKNRLIAIHYKSIRNTNPDKYPTPAGKSAIKMFNELAKNGGFIWSQYGNISKDLVGEIKPHSKIAFYGTEAWKTLKLKNVKEIYSGEFLAMRVAMPRQRVISKWHTAKERLRNIIRNQVSIPKWDELSSDQQETICAEYLRHINKLQHLLLPVGRTMQDVDIYGLTSEGYLLFGQVTFSLNEGVISEKIKSLQKYGLDKRNRLYFFSCQRDKEKFYNKLKRDYSKIYFIDTDIIFKWLKRDRVFLKKLFSS